jgi:predicted TIM-barrel fold metal-dependent hydrolase
VASLVCHGALSRFPELKLIIVENGASWVEPLLLKMAELWKKQPQAFAENPVDIVKRSVHISPFWEEDLGKLAGLLGEDRVCFGSDFPHPEGIESPRSYIDDLAHLPEELQRKIMGGNLSRLMNVPAEITA